MSYYKSLYDSNEIREGLMNIKQSQMQLLRQLKNQHHILKKYIPDEPIIEQRSDSNIYQNFSSTFPHNQNFHFNNSSQKNMSSEANTIDKNQNYQSFNTNKIRNNLYEVKPVQIVNDNFFRVKNQQNLSKQLETMTQDFHRMKKNYYTERQLNKDMILHMEFASSLHNLILKEVMQGIHLMQIKNKVKNQILSYQNQFPEFKAYGLEQAFNIINLQSDNFNLHSNSQLKTNLIRRNPIFPPKPSQINFQSNQLLKQINDLKSQIRDLNLQKSQKQQSFILSKSQNEYAISLLRKQVEMKNEKIIEIHNQTLRIKEININLVNDNNELKGNIQRLKSQLQRNLDKIQSLQTIQKKSYETIEKQHKYLKHLQQFQEKVAYYEKQNKSKTKLIQIHQQNVSKLNENFKSIKSENQKLKLEIQEYRSSFNTKSNIINELEQRISQIKRSHQEQIIKISKNYQNQTNSLKRHIDELKRNLQILISQQQNYKTSQIVLQQLKAKRLQTIKFSKTIDHLWKIKQVEYDNLNEIITKLKQFTDTQNRTNQHSLKNKSKNMIS